MDQLLNLQGPSGLLEAILSQPTEEVSTFVIICHPHSSHGGSLHNKIVHTLMRTCRELMITSVRFNFRGVGKSGGHYDSGVGEADDVIAVLTWAKKQYPNAAIWLAGFSFGAFVVAKSIANCAADIEQLIMVAPPVESFDFSEIDFSSITTCVVMGEQDEVVDPLAVKKWATQHPTIQMLWLSDTDHFFHGRLTILKDTLITYLKTIYASRW